MRRFGTLTKLKPECIERYIDLHDHIPDEVVQAAHKYGLRNFTIYQLGEYLFSTFDYVGECYEKDMAEKALLPVMQLWSKNCNACFEMMPGQEKYDIVLKEIFHNDF